jgi:hypothetical protein
MSLMDMILTLDRVDAHRFIWSETLLAEWRRVVLRARPDGTARVDSLIAAIRTAFAATCVREEAFMPLVPTLSGPDPDDILHMAAAIAGNATILTTNNLRFRDREGLGRRWGTRLRRSRVHAMGRDSRIAATPQGGNVAAGSATTR